MCVCMCVCEREREQKRKRERENGDVFEEGRPPKGKEKFFEVKKKKKSNEWRTKKIGTQFSKNLFFAENVKKRKFPIEEKSHLSSRTLENFCP